MYPKKLKRYAKEFDVPENVAQYLWSVTLLQANQLGKQEDYDFMEAAFKGLLLAAKVSNPLGSWKRLMKAFAGV